MRRIKVLLCVGGGMIAVVLGGCAAEPVAEAGHQAAGPSQEEMVARGAYLVNFGGCHDCHTPWIFSEEIGGPMPDMSRALSGHPEGASDPTGTVGETDAALIGSTFTSFVMPFGTVYSMNLTPDVETGLGSWTQEMFVKAVRTGRHMGGEGRPVMPPMPWPNVGGATDEDLHAIWAYLQSLPPIRNHVPSPQVPEEVMWAMRDSNDKMLALMGAGG